MSPSAASRCRSARPSRSRTPRGEPPVAQGGHRLGDVLPPDLARLQEGGAELGQDVELEVAGQQVVAERAGRDVRGHQLDRLLDHGQPGERVAAAGALHDAAAVGPGDQVVAVAVGDHRDRLGVAVGVHGEVDVLADEHALAEPDAVPLQHLPAEQLPAAQAVVDGAVAQFHPIGGAVEHRLGGPPPVTDDLPEHDVGAVPVGGDQQVLQRLGAEVVVGVAEEHVAAGGVGEADVARQPGAAGVADPRAP